MKINEKAILYTIAVSGVLILYGTSCENGEDNTNTKLTDIDGNIYPTITLGTQTWMAENLNVTRYRNGDTIETTHPVTLDISVEEIPAYQWPYDGKESHAATYGRLYTWHVIADERCLCPAGWHVPSHSEWEILTNFLTDNGYGYQGSGNDIGKALAATSGWDTDTVAGTIGNDQASNNSSGFNGLPGGKRGGNGIFNFLGRECKWWSSTEIDNGAWGRSMSHSEGVMSVTIHSKDDGRSVRCLKDQDI